MQSHRAACWHLARYLIALQLQIPHLAKTLEFEQAVSATNHDGVTRIVAFDFEPLPLLRAIVAGKLPVEPPQAGQFEIKLTPDSADELGDFTL